LHHCF